MAYSREIRANRSSYSASLIFATAYDEYVIDALQRDGIAYLLKPLREPDVVGVADDGDFGDRGVTGDQGLEFGRRDVHAAADH